MNLTLLLNSRCLMLKQLIILNLLVCSPSAMAGVFKDGAWLASGCEAPPAAPVIEANTVDSYNASIRAVNDWQRLAKAYDDCIVNEANADSALIAKTATGEQGKLKDKIQNIDSELAAAKAKLGQKAK